MAHASVEFHDCNGFDSRVRAIRVALVDNTIESSRRPGDTTDNVIRWVANCARSVSEGDGITKFIEAAYGYQSVPHLGREKYLGKS
jgi:hypothetical protein